MRSILLIEDDPDIAHVVALHLADLDAEVREVRDGSHGLSLALGQPWDLVILDLMLPGTDGLEICRRLRTQDHYTPILMLTARSTETDRVVGLEMGADDYLTKPFSVRELLARIKALFRYRQALDSRGDAAVPRLERGEIVIDPGKRLVWVRGHAVELTSREFELLRHLAQRPGQVYSRAQLLDEVWGYRHEGYEHTVNSHINRLRAKIEEQPRRPRYVRTVWGVGYKFYDPAGA